MTLSKVRKALVAIAGAIVIVADGFGVNIDQSTLDAVVAAIVAVGVYLVPND